MEKVVKKTRRIYCGWKHKNSRKEQYIQIGRGKGGRVVQIDYNKEATLDEVQDVLLKTYFPGSKNCFGTIESMNMIYVGNFAGERIRAYLVSGELFSIDKYCQEIRHNPVHIYLFSELHVHEDSDEADLKDSLFKAYHEA